MRIVSITAGAAGMFCGSCLRDNTLAAALIRLGHDCLLLPTFTPLTLDEPDQSASRVFLGGVNVFLDEYRAARWLPRFARSWLDRPGILRFAARFSGIENYEKLGEMTISMLRGDHGRQRREFEDLLQFLVGEVKPQVVLVTNLLLSALAPLIRDRLKVPVIVSLQGDDIFLDALKAEHRAAALEVIRRNCTSVAGFIATSQYYADHMAKYAGLPRDAISVVYPGLDLSGHGSERRSHTGPPVVGYFARIDPQKGLHNLADAFVQLRKLLPDARLRISGWLGPLNKKYLDDILAKLGDAGEYVASPKLADKVAFLQSLDVLSVPTVYREPKGLYVLEALANGTPVVLPAHGSFPELIEQTGGGILVPPGDAKALAIAIGELLSDTKRLHELRSRGLAAVREKFTAARMAEDTLRVIHKCNEVRP
jgi:glycosyltransferase involved in cell wall biosynthesis